MSHIQFVDELVREYLLFRGFGGALKAFDADLKVDKDKGFRVDKIVDQLLQHVYNYDLTGLREAWNHLDTRLFIRLEQHFAPSIRKLENAVLKFYLVNASENNKQDKINEFFNKLTSELVNQAEWKDWFVLPFIKNPEEHAVFSVYFTRQWQDTLIVSLHNFLAAIYQSMPQPTLSSFEENASKMSALQKENEIIRKGLISLLNDQEKVIGSEPLLVQGFEGVVDDFFNIAHKSLKMLVVDTGKTPDYMSNIKMQPISLKMSENIVKSVKNLKCVIMPKKKGNEKIVKNNDIKSLKSGSIFKIIDIYREIKASENQAKLLKTIMKNIGSMPTSPKLESKEQSTRISHRKNSTKKVPQAKRSLSIDARPTHLKPRERDSSLDVMTSRTRDGGTKKDEAGVERVQEGNFLFLSREEYSEHKSHVICVKFNNRGNLVASGDKEGNLRVWSISPSCKTLASFINKSAITCLDWVPNLERYIICGNSKGSVTLYDTKEVKAMWNVNVELENLGKKVEDVVSSPVDPVAVAVLSGKVYILDLRTRKFEKSLNTNCKVTCVKMNHNGQLIIAGTVEGSVILLDLRKNEVIERWNIYGFPVSQLELTNDYTYVCALIHDKIIWKSLNQAKSKGMSLAAPEEMKIHPELHGRLFCLDNTGTLILTVGVNSGVIFKVSESSLTKSLELGGHKAKLTCVDWSFANQCATCVTASQDGKIKISTLLINSV